MLRGLTAGTGQPTAGARLLLTLGELRRRSEVDPLVYTRWTPPQDAYLRATAQIVLCRTGNQFGKTWVGAAETIYRCLGAHPHKEVPKGPIEAWVLCSSWSQSIAIQRKVWSLIPKDTITEDVRFNPKNGFVGVQKAVTFRNGSILRFKTTSQDTLDLASATIHWVWIDEPIADADTFTELQMRLRRTGGQIGITMTPATTGDLEWLRKLVVDGRVLDLHFTMTPENFVPLGQSEPLRTEDGTPMNAAWVEAQIEETLAWARPVRCHGEWEYGRVSKVFENFHPTVHVIPNLAQSSVAPQGEVKLSVGLDYGEDRLRTVAILVAVDDTTDPTNPRVYVLGEYTPDTSSTIDMDAKGILGMVAAAGLRWVDLDYAWGDKRYTDARGRITRKSNAMMTEALERAGNRKRGMRPAFRGAKKGIGGGRGAVWTGVRWLNSSQITPAAFYIDSSCTWLIESLNKWDGTDRSPHKDAVDALRYGLRPWIYPRRSHKPRRLVRRF